MVTCRSSNSMSIDMQIVSWQQWCRKAFPAVFVTVRREAEWTLTELYAEDFWAYSSVYCDGWSIDGMIHNSDPN